MNLSEMTQRLLVDYNDKIQSALIKICKDNNVEISEQGAKRITRIIFGNETNYSEFWLDYETDSRKLLMSTEIKFYNQNPTEIKLPELIIQ